MTVPVYLDYQQQEFTAGLDAAATAAEAAGTPVSALLFTNPTNPQGLLFSREQLGSMMQWCLKKKVHFISDEVYANSIFDESAMFLSAAHVAATDAPNMEAGELADELVHIIYGFSKDFCASGLRVGCLHTKSKALQKTLGNLSYFCSVGCPLQWSLAKLLDDQQWLTHYLDENKRRLRAGYALLTGALDAAGIPYVPASAGMFLWVDLSAALTGSSNDSKGSGDIGNSNGSSSSALSWSDESSFWDYLVTKHRVVLTPGFTFHAAVPGWFRMCWAWLHPDSLPVAVERIVAATKGWQQQKQQTAAK
eukprot:GHRR01021506.1.p1 GENE.GHRR01021506.1~~GHRR01021506.1.p1  ORF type:complete len:307 (+),score=134.13 GHRR01021506.1:431-1351(+)